MKNLIMLYLFVCLTFALPVTFSEVFSEQPAVYTFTVPSESSAQLKDYLAELEKYGASEEVKEMIKKSGIRDWWASVGNNIHFLEWLETRTIVKQIGKKNEVLVYEMDIKKAYQHKKELCAQFKMVGDDAATGILYGLVRTAIAFNDKEMVRFFIDLPGPDGAGSTNKQNILWEIKDAIPITFLQVFFEQPKEVQEDIVLFLGVLSEGMFQKIVYISMRVTCYVFRVSCFVLHAIRNTQYAPRNTQHATRFTYSQLIFEQI